MVCQNVPSSSMLSVEQEYENPLRDFMERKTHSVIHSDTNEVPRPSTSDSDIVSEEPLGRRERRKRKVVDIGGLDDCLCGSRAEPTANNVIRCKRVGCETVWVSKPTFCRDFNIKLTYIFLSNHFSITSFVFTLSRCPRIGSAMHVQRREEDEEGRLRGGDIILCYHFLK